MNNYLNNLVQDTRYKLKGFGLDAKRVVQEMKWKYLSITPKKSTIRSFYNSLGDLNTYHSINKDTSNMLDDASSKLEGIIDNKEMLGDESFDDINKLMLEIQNLSKDYQTQESVQSKQLKRLNDYSERLLARYLFSDSIPKNKIKQMSFEDIKKLNDEELFKDTGKYIWINNLRNNALKQITYV